MSEPFGPWLRALRKEAEMSQRDMAAALSIDHTYLSKIEAGKMPPPGDVTLSAIASCLSLDVDMVYLKAGKVPPTLTQAFQRGVSEATYRALLEAL